MAAGPPITANSDNLRDKAQVFFEPQLVALGLGENQIKEQNLEELMESLERINEIIANPSSFGTYRISGSISVVLTKTDSHIEVGVLPIALERKKIIKDRIKFLEGEKKIDDLKVKIDDESDEGIRVEIEREMIELRFKLQSEMEKSQKNDAEIDKWQKQAMETEKALLQAQRE